MPPFLEGFDPVAWLKAEQVLAIPTETVYGLAGRADSVTAVERIYAIKNRPHHNPLIIHYAHTEAAVQEGIFCVQGEDIVRSIWPGPLTVLVPKALRSCVVPQAHCFLPCLAMRVPQHPIAQTLISKVGPLAAPSANPSGLLSPTTTAHVRALFQGTVPVVEGGACMIGLESTILDLRESPFRILRPGFWTLERLSSQFPAYDFIESDHADITTPGSSLQHYAPNKPLHLDVVLPIADSMGVIGFGPFPESVREGYFVQLSWEQDLEEAARNVFAALHYLDQALECTHIGVVPIPHHGMGRAIRDRLVRAAHQ
jgi:L-threonylcarbamoyladenylate synthase